MALTQDKLLNDTKFPPTPLEGGAAPDGVIIWGGAMVGVETAAGANQGLIVTATASTSIRVLGVAVRKVDTIDAVEPLVVEIDASPRYMQNSGGADAIAAHHRGLPCYVVDDETVALTDGGGTRPRAGIVRNVGDRVLVQFDLAGSGGLAGSLPLEATLQITDDDLTAAALSQTFTLLASPDPGLYVLYGEVPEVFAGGGAISATLDAGINTTNPDLLAAAVDVFTAPLAYGPLEGDQGPVGFVQVPAGSNDLEVIITSSVNVNLLTTGDATLRLFKIG